MIALDRPRGTFLESELPFSCILFPKTSSMNAITVRPFVALKLSFFATAALILLSGCEIGGIPGNGRIVTDKRPVSDFTSVEANGAFQIEWTPGAPAVSIITDQNLLTYVISDVSAHKLVLHSRERLRPTHGMVVRIASSSLNGAALHGAVRLEAKKLAGSNFFLDAQGATRVALDGSVTALTASMEGASRLDADGLRTQITEMSISGAGRAEVSATEKLKVGISGAGKVVYSGNPKTVEKRVSGAGSIHRKG
jgi:hypothetical protein